MAAIRHELRVHPPAPASDFTVPVYDGARRFDVLVHVVSVGGKERGIRLLLTLRPIAGFKGGSDEDVDPDDAPRPVQAVFTHDADLMPISMRVSVWYLPLAYSGNYDFYEQQRALSETQRQAQFERQQAMLAKEIKFIERFKARASHAAQVQSRVKKLDKIERVEPPRRREAIQFEFRSPPRSGDDVASFKDVHKGYGSQPVYTGLDFRVRRKERWCVLGANGAGKSTLLKLVAGAEEPDQGRVTVGSNVRMGYFAQHSMDLLDGDDTVFESLDESFPQAGQGALRSLAGCFGFSGDDVEKPCRVLSGGEKARLVMAKMLFDPPNFLVLDEPTNHLDMATKEMLVAALAEFEGTMLFVSHDRHFLAALSNRVLELTPDGVHQFGGGYTEYVARTGHEAPGLHPGG